VARFRLEELYYVAVLCQLLFQPQVVFRAGQQVVLAADQNEVEPTEVLQVVVGWFWLAISLHVHMGVAVVELFEFSRLEHLLEVDNLLGAAARGVELEVLLQSILVSVGSVGITDVREYLSSGELSDC